MKKIMFRIIFLIFILFIILSVCNFKVYATDDIIQGAKDFLNKGNDPTLNVSSIKKTSDMIFNVFSIVGTVIVVIVGAILGIQFIMGSTEEKAKVKETLIPYGIGSVIIFGAVAIWSIMIEVLGWAF